MRIFGVSLALGGFLLFFGCGSSESADSSSSSSSGSATSSSGASSGAGSSSGGNGEPEPFTPAPKLRTGTINLFLGASSPGAGDNTLRIAGYFLDYSAAPAGSVPDGYSFVGVRATECTRRTSGTCEAVRCKAVEDPSFAFSKAKYATAGEITVRRVASGTELKSTADAQSSNAYLGSIADPASGTDGESVTVTATGGDVPAFEETVTFRPLLVLSSPAEVSVPKGTDVVVEWTGGNGTVKLSGTGGSGGEALVGMTCTFDAPAGKGTIPGVLLGDDVVGHTLSLGLYSIASTKTVGDYEVELTAQLSDSGLGGGNVQLEVK
jgi:hypothetical protein